MDSVLLSDFSRNIKKYVFDNKEIFLSDYEVEKILNGVFIPVAHKNGDYKVYSNKEFLGVGRVKDGVLRLNLRLI